MIVCLPLPFVLLESLRKHLLNLYVEYCPKILEHINSLSSSKQLYCAKQLGHPFHKWNYVMGFELSASGP